MKQIITTSILFLIVSINSQAQYTVKSKYILEPELNIEYVRNNAEFWIKHAYDPEYGGFFSNVDQYGNVTTMTPQRSGFGTTPYKRKSLIVQSRHGYGFTRAFMLTGDEKYLDYAKSALDLLTKYGWDKVNGGWYCFAKSDGTIDLTQNDLRDLNQKWGFQQHYGLLGIVANYEATRNPKIAEFMNKGIASIYNNMWDSRAGYKGYYEYTKPDWTGKTNKGFTPTVDAITTNAELTYLITQQPEYKTRLMELADNIVDHFIPQMENKSVKALYPEVFSTNWVADLNASKNGSIGHFIKTAWCLGRAYLCDTTKTEYKEAADKILNQVWTWKNGSVALWDHTNGGPFNAINILTGEWGTNGNLKDYWTLEQGFTGPMLNYYITKNDTYLQMADESIGFFMEHLVDSINGEIFSDTYPDGTVVRRSIKGDDYKGSYHSIEMGYYAYLYSKLYYLNQSADLYYKFEPSPEERQITLTPIPIQDKRLKIKSVTLDGNDFDNFNADTRTLTLASNQSGKFKVTFESVPQNPSGIDNIVTQNQVKVYPTLFKENIYIDGIQGNSVILITDLAGKVVYQQKNIELSLNVNLGNLASGIYIITVYQESGLKSVHKIIKQ